jgi:hypothetical protein
VLAAEIVVLRIVLRRTLAMAAGLRAARVQRAAQGDEARSSARHSPRIGRAGRLIAERQTLIDTLWLETPR